MRILITGGAGFIGSHLADKLIQQGHRVIVVDNLLTGSLKNLHPAFFKTESAFRQAKFYRLDITDKRISKLFDKEKPEAIFHLAAQIDARKSVKDPFSDAKTNLLGFLNILQNVLYFGKLWGRFPKLIFSSTGGAIYGETKKIPTSENHPISPKSPYGLSKKATEDYLLLYHQLFGLDFIALRYSNVYGPRQKSSNEAGVISIFIDKLLRQKPLVIFGDGAKTRDYVYIDDVVKANILALKKDTASLRQAKRLINIGTGKETSLNELAGLLFFLTGRETKIIYEKEKQGEVRRSALKTNRAKQVLGWQAKVDLKKGLKKTIKP